MSPSILRIRCPIEYFYLTPLPNHPTHSLLKPLVSCSGFPSVPLSLTTYTQRNKDVMNKEKGVTGNLFSRRIGGRRSSR